MAKSKRLWSDVCILVDESDTDSSSEYQGEGEGDTTTAGYDNNDDTEVGTNTVTSSTAAAVAAAPPSTMIGSVVKPGRGGGGATPTTTTAWEGVSLLADDAETLDSVTAGPSPAPSRAHSPLPGANNGNKAILLLDTVTPI
jgi:hypothetical protein